jgi:hypothetical protein
MSDWQTIESAPRDGTPILSWDGVRRVVIIWSTRDKGWFLDGADDRPDWTGVTHWMPLPEPPK